LSSNSQVDGRRHNSGGLNALPWEWKPHAPPLPNLIFPTSPSSSSTYDPYKYSNFCLSFSFFQTIKTADHDHPQPSTPSINYSNKNSYSTNYCNGYTNESTRTTLQISSFKRTLRMGRVDIPRNWQNLQFIHYTFIIHCFIQTNKGTFF
jgi:hypothetical protein